MSNPLYISVGTYAQFDQPHTQVVVLASDSYGSDALTFDDVDHLLDVYPTEEDLVATVLQLPTFEGAATFKGDGTYDLDAVSFVIVQGFPER